MRKPRTMKQATRAAIVAALRHTAGDRDRAAKVLKIGRATLYRQLRRLEIKPEEYAGAKNGERNDVPEKLGSDPEPYAESPEDTGKWTCPQCGNAEKFRGVDTAGYPGDDCDCEQDPCECEVELTQDFDVSGGEVVNYHEFVGGGSGACIGRYNRIECRTCDFVIWASDGKAAPAPEGEQTDA